MSSIASAEAVAVVVTASDRLEVLFGELAELAGQRNAIDGRIVEIVAEIDRDGLCGVTGARSVPALVAWKLGCSSGNAHTIAAIAARLEEFPRCVEGLREGRLSADQVGVIAARAGEGSDEHYAELAAVATVGQLRTAVKLEPRPDPGPRPEPEPSITKSCDEWGGCYRITLGHHDAAKFDAALAAHREALIAEWKHDHANGEGSSDQRPPLPSTVDALMRLVEAGWDAEATRRPHGQHTTVVAHLDVGQRAATLHLGPLLSDAERRLLTCDATCEVWFERDGQVIGAGRTTRVINRRLRRALEYRDRTCVVPGCGASRGLHAHHLWHWEDGGPTELANLVLVCPYHHRLHHRGVITLTGPADALTVTDEAGRVLSPGSLAHPPTRPPPAVPPCPGPTGERADWWWYDPFQPQPPPTNN
ncbi:HNH endonuclease signature motif containing protein [Mycobacterium intracellulare]|uniref:HNH endonuclease signature motif containing protein n=1 Tax=Mycobacterium intracellulare TaxID=1767 RepID=UPI00044AA9A7|nr:HNH endonuclease signature motif containing protein [Mycobacterium intracellulare]ETZ33501.1 HNH endonuclease family protein [Mycobacterium intracellulare MIN_061107_1834]MCA2252852.1 HNH endonuclease [Mycobacterium intracellulare]MCA2273214.1 HNH endonuclease [Mycobacterium intracellulare]MCA2305104.1 HNH endonuclease [Mycobacterium intracellulare]MCA2325983.1 HNH endonuclease [Mycobacterium intracellulare]